MATVKAWVTQKAVSLSLTFAYWAAGGDPFLQHWIGRSITFMVKGMTAEIVEQRAIHAMTLTFDSKTRAEIIPPNTDGFTQDDLYSDNSVDKES